MPWPLVPFCEPSSPRATGARVVALPPPLIVSWWRRVPAYAQELDKLESTMIELSGFSKADKRDLRSAPHRWRVLLKHEKETAQRKRERQMELRALVERCERHTLRAFDESVRLEEEESERASMRLSIASSPGRGCASPKTPSKRSSLTMSGPSLTDVTLKSLEPGCCGQRAGARRRRVRPDLPESLPGLREDAR